MVGADGRREVVGRLFHLHGLAMHRPVHICPIGRMDDIAAVVWASLTVGPFDRRKAPAPLAVSCIRWHVDPIPRTLDPTFHLKTSVSKPLVNDISLRLIATLETSAHLKIGGRSTRFHARLASSTVKIFRACRFLPGGSAGTSHQLVADGIHEDKASVLMSAMGIFQRSSDWAAMAVSRPFFRSFSTLTSLELERSPSARRRLGRA